MAQNTQHPDRQLNENPHCNTKDPQPLYEPLQQHEFRLIELRESSSLDIECTLKTVSWRDHPPYSALSYVWGSHEGVATILLNSQPVKVTSNLKAALGLLVKSDCDKTFWIDALCIDQSNTTERGHQVKAMPSIYANAATVLVFLRMLKRTNAYSWEPELAREYKNIYQDPYWTRVWVTQEIAHAQCAKVLLPGRPLRNFDDVLDFRKFKDSREKVNPEWELRAWDEVAALHHEGPARMAKVGSARRPPNFASGQMQWLSTIHGKHCKDPRDYIYGLLYLFPPELVERIQVDYKSPVAEIFLSFTISYIETTHDLAVICWGKNGRICPDYPSWAGNFAELVHDPFTSFDLHMRGLSVGSSITPTVRFSADSKNLNVRGNCIGTIERVTSLDATDLASTFTAMELKPEPSILRAFGRTFMLGQNDFSIDDLDDLNRFSPGWSEHLQRKLFRFSPSKSVKDGDNGEILHTTSRILLPERRARSGKLIEEEIRITRVDLGVGPSEMQPGDQMFLIFGCSLLIILRAVGDQYRVIGDAYADGFLGGQVAPEVVLDNHQDIVLI